MQEKCQLWNFIEERCVTYQYFGEICSVEITQSYLLATTADIYTVICRDVPKHGFSVVQANTHRLTGQSKRESMFWNVSTNYCIYISCDDLRLPIEIASRTRTYGEFNQYI